MHEGNDKADRLCKLAINLLREVDEIQQQGGNDQEYTLLIHHKQICIIYFRMATLQPY